MNKFVLLYDTCYFLINCPLLKDHKWISSKQSLHKKIIVPAFLSMLQFLTITQSIAVKFCTYNQCLFLMQKDSLRNCTVQKQSTDFSSGWPDSEFNTIKWNWARPGALLQAAPARSKKGKKEILQAKTKCYVSSILIQSLLEFTSHKHRLLLTGKPQ